ncbi:Conserved_hypothetical protein [Hexamita inflata]|uniref:Uncharacterized protein n=1 Tax=Hexamita inflata TaxID=28002 RepID=A0AA86QFE0_9EUKA|nr:Conserved hypothetical protein [Hexamita inflata]
MENQAPQAFKFNFNQTVKIDTSFLQNSKQLQDDEPKQNLQFPSLTNKIRNEENKQEQTKQNDVANNQDQVGKFKGPNLFQIAANNQNIQPFNFNKTVKVDPSFLQNSKQIQNEPKQNLKFTNTNQIKNEENKLVQTKQNDVTNNQDQVGKIKGPNLFQRAANNQNIQPFNFNKTVKVDPSFQQNIKQLLAGEPKQNLKFTNTNQIRNEENKQEYTKQNDVTNNQDQGGKIKEPNLFQLMVNSQCQPEIKQIDPHLLMNVRKIFPDLDIYLQIGLKTIAILDSQMKILSEMPIFGDNLNGIKGDILKQNTQQYHTVMYKGVIYIIMFNDIYFIQNQSLKHLCQIPAINGVQNERQKLYYYAHLSKRSQLFAINNQLYLSCQEQLYIYNNGKFKLVKEYVKEQVLLDMYANQQRYDYFCQFGNNVFCLKSNQVFRVLANLQFTLILKTELEFEILCVQGGIIMLSLLSQNVVIGEIIVINMLTDEAKHFKDIYGEQKAYEIAHKINSSRANNQKDVCQEQPTEIQQLFCLGECGLQLNTEVQKKIFGEEFPEKCKVEFDKFMKSQMTQTYINEMVKFVKPLRQDWKELEEKHAGTAVLEEKDQYLHDCQLLNVMKLAPNLDVYMAIEDNFIHIINKEKKILHQIQVDFDYYVGKQFKVTQSNPKTACFQNLVHNFINNITFHNGSMYLQAFDKVYRIRNMKTELVATLPYLNLNYFKNQPQSLGSNSQHLVVHCDQQRQYILNNGKFKLNKYSSLQCYNFCGYSCDWDETCQAIVFRTENDEGKIQRILYNKQDDDDDKLVKNSFFSSGILILSSSAFEIVYVFNIVTQQFKKLQFDTRFSKNNIYDNVELGVAGIQLKNEILAELFGQESILKIKEAYENHYFMITNQYPELKNELNCYVCKAKGQIPLEHTTVSIQGQIDKPIQQNSILQKCQLMNVVKLKSNYNIYLAIEDNNMYIIDEQRRIYGQYQVDYDMYAGIVQNYERGPSYAYEYNATICNGEIYVTKFDQVYKVHNQQLLFIAKIPCDSQCECILYSQNNQLYAINGQGTQYQLRNQHLPNDIKFFPINYQFPNWHYQFCDKLLLYEQGQQLQVLGHDNYLNISEYVNIIVNQGGVVILKTNRSKQTQICMINLISGQIESSKNKALIDDQLWLDSIELGGSGLQINDELINKIFNKPGDKPVSEQANDMQKSYLTDLEQNSKNWSEQIQQLLPFNVMLNFFENYESEKFEKIDKSFLKTKEQIITRQRQVLEKIAKITNKYNGVIVSFAETFRTESTQ